MTNEETYEALKGYGIDEIIKGMSELLMQMSCDVDPVPLEEKIVIWPGAPAESQDGRYVIEDDLLMCIGEDKSESLCTFDGKVIRVGKGGIEKYAKDGKIYPAFAKYDRESIYEAIIRQIVRSDTRNPDTEYIDCLTDNTKLLKSALASINGDPT